VALLAMALMSWTATRYAALRREQAAAAKDRKEPLGNKLSAGRVTAAMAVLVILLFSKNAYTAGFTSYYTFYLIEAWAGSRLLRLARSPTTSASSKCSASALGFRP
jgi:FSR family fosmidomycin resistance protein-like MFS transporter